MAQIQLIKNSKLNQFATFENSKMVQSYLEKIGNFKYEDIKNKPEINFKDPSFNKHIIYTDEIDDLNNISDYQTAIIWNHPYFRDKFTVWDINKTVYSNNKLVGYEVEYLILANNSIYDILDYENNDIAITQKHISYKNELNGNEFKLKRNSILREGQPIEKTNIVPTFKGKFFYVDSMHLENDTDDWQPNPDDDSDVGFINNPKKYIQFYAYLCGFTTSNSWNGLIPQINKDSKMLAQIGYKLKDYIQSTKDGSQYYASPFTILFGVNCDDHITDKSGLLDQGTLPRFNVNDVNDYIQGSYNDASKWLTELQQSTSNSAYITEIPPVAGISLNERALNEYEIKVDNFTVQPVPSSDFTVIDGKRIINTLATTNLEQRSFILFDKLINQFYDISSDHKLFTFEYATKDYKNDKELKLSNILEIQFWPYKEFEVGLKSEAAGAGFKFTFNEMLLLNGKIIKHNDGSIAYSFFQARLIKSKNIFNIMYKLLKSEDFNDIDNIPGNQFLKFKRNLFLPIVNDLWDTINKNQQLRIFNQYSGVALKTANSLIAGATVAAINPIAGLGVVGSGLLDAGINIFATHEKNQLIKQTPDSVQNVSSELSEEMGLKNPSNLNLIVNEPNLAIKKQSALFFHLYGTYHFNRLVKLDKDNLLPKDRFNFLQLTINNQSLNWIKPILNNVLRTKLLSILKMGVHFWNWEEGNDIKNDLIFNYTVKNPDKD